MTRRVITLAGKRQEEKVALVAEIRTEFERALPDLAAARAALVEAGMMEPGFRAIRAIKTESIDYDVRRDDPAHDDKLYNKPPIITEEIIHERHQLQARKARQARAAELVPDRRGGRRGR